MTLLNDLQLKGMPARWLERVLCVSNPSRHHWCTLHVPSVKQLIARGVDVNGVDEDGWTPLIWAAKEGFVECVKVLLEAKADLDKALDGGLTPLHIASRYGHVECVKVRMR